MNTSARIQDSIARFLSDQKNHSVQEIKTYLIESNFGEYSEGQFAGSINTLLRNGTIRKIDRGIYAIQNHKETPTIKIDVIPFSKMMLPLLKALQSLGGSANIDELDSRTIEIMQLPEEMVNVLHKEDGTQTKIVYRLAWARTYLKKYGLIDNSAKGVWAFAEAFDGNIDNLSVNEIVKSVRAMSKKTNTDAYEDGDLENDGIELPEEAMSWRDNLRDELLKLSPEAFERLTLRLLRESGFAQVEVLGKSNDHGIDGKGIIRLNEIMSFHMIFQCKRYKGNVSPSEIRDFRGAMQGRADKGLFITTGAFTSEAKKEATRDGAPPLDLMDGSALIERLKDLRLGVKEKIITDYEVDAAWFKKI
jgi:restriction system protein